MLCSKKSTSKLLEASPRIPWAIKEFSFEQAELPLSTQCNRSHQKRKQSMFLFFVLRDSSSSPYITETFLIKKQMSNNTYKSSPSSQKETYTTIEE